MPSYLSPGVYVEEVPSGSAPIAGVGTSTAGFIGVIPAPATPATAPAKASAGGKQPAATGSDLATKAGEIKLCTNFGEFKKFFWDFSQETAKNLLAHAVYGFFNNGGTRCYVVWVAGEADIAKALESFEAIDEIAIVAAPGVTSTTGLTAVKDHCAKLGDRFAILDSPETVDMSSANLVDTLKTFNSDYAAMYLPWITVFDPASNKEMNVPPSGHMAGIYARVDTQRGVHKAPANETVMGAVGLKYNISKAQQDGLNPKGINCIRSLNGNIRVWGARTLGGDDNGEFKYINVRRLFNFLRESIDEGTQWAVFEPNSPELWAKIRRNVTAFLMMVWRSGALFGTAPEQAFFVKCDEETNPPEVRDAGQVVTVIGVAVVKPAEFVIFRISQWAGPGGS
ncbi:phage tail sheath family protein [Kamptonema formosum]|uniref:phage tail sheath family protein n=1 Tax=Kamptonema formosum TaxID=331992 RepID=UPI00037D3D62|nr:phage tail sheath subtilisin-like domain-containing protein [Oscillatoria sp. PCC 10802]